MRFIFLSFFLFSCATQTVSSRPIVALLSPVPVNTSPKTFPLHEEIFAFDWQDRSFRFFHAPAKLKGKDESWQRMYGFGPVLEVTMGKQKKLLDLREKLPSHVITRVLEDPHNRRIWVLFEGGIEGPANAYAVLISEDGGDYWFEGAELERPAPGFPPSELSHLWVNGAGEGEAWFALEENNEAELKGGQQVLYRSTTSDGGRSWVVGREPVRRNGLMEVKRTD